MAQFDNIDQNNSYAIVGGFLEEAVAKRGTGPVVYHPSNLGAWLAASVTVSGCGRDCVRLCETV